LKYRCSEDIIAKILDAALPGVTKTKIMMHAHLNHMQFKRYIPYALSEYLIEKRKDPIDSIPIYATTEKGRIILQKYGEVRIRGIE